MRVLRPARSIAADADAAPETGASSSPADPAGPGEAAPGGSAMMAQGQLPSSADEATVATDRKTITLADVAIALVIVLTTVVALKNLPGLVEIVMLQRFALRGGPVFPVGTAAAGIGRRPGITFPDYAPAHVRQRRGDRSAEAPPSRLPEAPVDPQAARRW